MLGQATTQDHEIPTSGGWKEAMRFGSRLSRALNRSSRCVNMESRTYYSGVHPTASSASHSTGLRAHGPRAAVQVTSTH